MLSAETDLCWRDLTDGDIAALRTRSAFASSQTLRAQVVANAFGDRDYSSWRVSHAGKALYAACMRVLVVDDDEEVRSVVTRALERDGHAVTTASTMHESRAALESGVDLVVLDLGLPDGSGIELCREIRARELRLPILILTARTQVNVRVEGLDAGADDYLAKPFAISELRARVRALGRRGNVSRAFTHVLGDVVLDLAGRKATRAGQVVPVTAREWSIIEVLANRVGRFTTRSALLDSVWGDASEQAGNSLEVLIARLRKKFGAEFIETLRGEGYSLRGKGMHGDAT